MLMNMIQQILVQDQAWDKVRNTNIKGIESRVEQIVKSHFVFSLVYFFPLYLRDRFRLSLSLHPSLLLRSYYSALHCVPLIQTLFFSTYLYADYYYLLLFSSTLTRGCCVSWAPSVVLCCSILLCCVNAFLCAVVHFCAVSLPRDVLSSVQVLLH